jgi:hypothetical protein
MVDEIRRCTAKKRQRQSFVTACRDLTRSTPEREAVSELQVALFLWRNRTEFEKHLGGRLFAVLRIECCGCLDGISKGAVTKRIARHFRVNVRQARTYRAQLRQCIAGISLPRLFFA